MSAVNQLTKNASHLGFRHRTADFGVYKYQSLPQVDKPQNCMILL